MPRAKGKTFKVTLRQDHAKHLENLCHALGIKPSQLLRSLAHQVLRAHPLICPLMPQFIRFHGDPTKEPPP